MYTWKMIQSITQPAKWSVCPAKTQISLGICPVWSESSLPASRRLVSLAIPKVHIKDSLQTGGFQADLNLCWRHISLLVLSYCGSNETNLVNFFHCYVIVCQTLILQTSVLLYHQIIACDIHSKLKYIVSLLKDRTVLHHSQGYLLLPSQLYKEWRNYFEYLV